MKISLEDIRTSLVKGSPEYHPYGIESFELDGRSYRCYRTEISANKELLFNTAMAWSGALVKRLRHDVVTIYHGDRSRETHCVSEAIIKEIKPLRDDLESDALAKLGEAADFVRILVVDLAAGVLRRISSIGVIPHLGRVVSGPTVRPFGNDIFNPMHQVAGLAFRMRSVFLLTARSREMIREVCAQVMRYAGDSNSYISAKKNKILREYSAFVYRLRVADEFLTRLFSGGDVNGDSNLSGWAYREKSI